MDGAQEAFFNRTIRGGNTNRALGQLLGNFFQFLAWQLNTLHLLFFFTLAFKSDIA